MRPGASPPSFPHSGLFQHRLDPRCELRFIQFAFVLLDDRPRLADENARGRCLDAVHLADGTVGVPADRVVDLVHVEKRFRQRLFVPLDVDAEDSYPTGPIFRVQRCQNGSLPLTVRSGRVPEIENHRLPAEVLQGHRLAVKERELEIRRRLPCRDCGQR